MPRVYNGGRPPVFTGKVKTKDPNVPAKTGRPRKPIDWDLVGRLARHGSTPKEIASILEVTEPTLRSYSCFFSIYKKEYMEGNACLRRRQYRAAMAGNPTLLIWIGKNRLGQRDNITVSGDPMAPLEVNMHAPDLKRLSDAELQTLMVLTAKAEGETLEAEFEVVPQLQLNGKVKVKNGRNGKAKK